MKKRMLAIVVALCVVITGFQVFGAYPDVPETTSYYEAVNLLSAMGVIKGYEDGTFGPDRDVTRAEFTTMLVRAMNMEELAKSLDTANDFPFDDCTSAGIAYALPNIKLAFSKGIILGMGDRQFAPEANVTYEQAVKMIVCAAGYDPRALDEGGYPYGYINIAQTLSILTGVNGEINAPAKRWQIAQLLYNALPVALMQKIATSGDTPTYTVDDNKTWLTEFLQLNHSTGIVVADPITTIGTAGFNPRVGECVIEDAATMTEELFKSGDYASQINGLIGKTVSYYYSTNNSNREKTLKFIQQSVNRGTSTIIQIKDMRKNSGGVVDLALMNYANGGSIKYWKDADSDNPREDSIFVGNNATFILNGKIFTPASQSEYEKEMKSLASGEVEFVDSDSIGGVDKLFITRVETYFVKSVTTDPVTGAKSILDTYRNTNPEQVHSYKVDENDALKIVTIKNKAGNTVALSGISTNSVVEIKESRSGTGRNLVDILVLTDTVTGKVTETGDDEVAIDGKAYKISPYYQKYAVGNTADHKITLNTNATFYLDSSGEIAGVNKTVTSTKYGYIYNADMKNDMATDELVIMLIDNLGSKRSYNITKRISIDGKSVTPADALAELRDAAKNTNFDTTTEQKNTAIVDKEAYGVSQLVKYQLDSSGYISSIVTNRKNGAQIASDVLNPSELKYTTRPTGEKAPLTYTENGSAGTFSDGNVSIATSSSTVMFIIDPYRTDKSIKGSTGNLDTTDGGYVAEAYDVNTTNLAAAIVVYKTADQALVEITAGTPISIMTNRAISTNPSGDDAVKYSAHQASTGYTFKKDIWTNSTSTLNEIKIGDVFKIVADSDGHMRKEEGGLKMIWDVNSPTPSTENNPEINVLKPHSSFRYGTIVGYIHSIDGTRISVIPETDKSKLDQTEKRYSFDVPDACGILMYVGARENNPVMPHEGEEKITMENLRGSVRTYVDNPDDPTEVLIHVSSSTGSTFDTMTPRLIYAIERAK